MATQSGVSAMPFVVEPHSRSFPGQTDAPIWLLHNPDAGCAAEIAPTFGCNCYHWYVTIAGQRRELLYADPDVFPGGRPTRSGIPILFPFPNRIRAGQFNWQGRTFNLPLNDATGKHAIHGFACRHSWRVVHTGCDATSASLTAVYHASVDAAATLAHWPADHRLTVTFRLQRDRLRVEATVDNPDRTPLPFGLGYHPYFRIDEQTEVTAPAKAFWVLEENLPTGAVQTVDNARNLNQPRVVQQLQLDDVLTQLPTSPVNDEGLVLRGRCGRLALWSSPVFRELVAFTPPHRQAVCLEPQTCATDAVHLQAHGIDAGWLVLQPGERWSAVVEMVVTS